jgi:hypothetical protein
MRFFVFIGLVVISLGGNAQSDSAIFSFKSLIGYNLNPGISLGVGGGRVNGYFPQATIKLGRFELGYTRWSKKDQNNRMGFQLDVEAYKFNGWDAMPAAATVGFFVNGWDNTFLETTTEKFNTGFLVGLDQNRGERSKFSLKMGIINTHTFIYRGDYSYYFPETYSVIKNEYRTYPYGEISYRFYAFSIAEKQKVIRKMLKREIRFDGPKIKEDLGRWFNPYLSIGAGLDRAFLVMPSVGIRIGPVSADISGMYFESASLGAKLTIDAIPIRKVQDERRYITVGVAGSGVADYGGSTSVVSVNVGMINYNSEKKRSTSFYVGLGRWEDYSIDDYPYTEDGEIFDQSTSRGGWMPTVGVSRNLYMFESGGNQKNKQKHLKQH